MIEYIHIFISIIAGIIYITVGILVGQDAGDTLYRLIFIIIGAYIVGLILRAFLRRTIVKEEPEAEIDILAELNADSENPELEPGLDAAADEFDLGDTI